MIFWQSFESNALLFPTIIFCFYIIILLMIHTSNSNTFVDEDELKLFITDRKCDLKPDFVGNFIADRPQLTQNNPDEFLLNVKKETKYGVEFQFLRFDECYLTSGDLFIVKRTFYDAFGTSIFVGYLLYLVAYFSAFPKINFQLDNFVQAVCLPLFMGVLTLMILN